jgi:hypothetical protein
MRHTPREPDPAVPCEAAPVGTTRADERYTCPRRSERMRLVEIADTETP